MLGGFVYYQSRNSTEIDTDVIYNQVGYMFTINMLANAFWLFLFGHDESSYFGFALLDIILMLVTAVSTLNISTHSHLNNWYENIFFRGGMSIYAGWVTTATILNVSFFLKSLGVDTGNTNVPNEIFWSRIVLTVAFLIYNSYSAIERNPLYGAVFIWVLTAIKSNIKKNDELADLLDFI